MPIVIRELVIRARVEEAAASPRTGPERPARGEPRLQEADLQRIVALCVEKIMENLDKRQDR